MLKRLLPAVLAAAMLIGAALPVLADHRDRGRDRGDRGSRVRARSGHRGEMGARADRIARRAENLYDEDRLSRDHLDRTLAKLDRVWGDTENRGRQGRQGGQRIQANQQWLDEVEETLQEWSRSDSRSSRRSRR